MKQMYFACNTCNNWEEAKTTNLGGYPPHRWLKLEVPTTDDWRTDDFIFCSKKCLIEYAVELVIPPLVLPRIKRKRK